MYNIPPRLFAGSLERTVSCFLKGFLISKKNYILVYYISYSIKYFISYSTRYSVRKFLSSLEGILQGIL